MYNGLGMPTGWRIGRRFVTGGDADADADVDGSDPWYSFAMDDRWRIVATFRAPGGTSDTSPKELFAYHNAGANGRGSSSYIDSVILRNKDANTAWTTASDGTLEERIYYVQNWRADVSAVLSDAGVVKEWVKYTSYGIPFRIDPGDYNRDGFVNGTDFDDYGDDFDNARAEADVNFDGSVNGDDYDLFAEWFDAPSTAGRFTLSASLIGNRVGYAGYQHDPTFIGASRAIFHVRNRVYDAGLGRWLRRDPIGYKAGVDLYAYVNDEPNKGRDPMGLGPEDPYGDFPDTPTKVDPSRPLPGIRVRCLKIPLLPGSHCWIEIKPDANTPLSTCSGHNPAGYPFTKPSAPLRSECGPWEYSTDHDYLQHWGGTPVDTPIMCSPDTVALVDLVQVYECLEQAGLDQNKCHIPYRWQGPNSNSFARCALEKCLPSGCKLPNPPNTQSLAWPWGWDMNHEQVCACICAI